MRNRSFQIGFCSRVTRKWATRNKKTHYFHHRSPSFLKSENDKSILYWVFHPILEGLSSRFAFQVTGNYTHTESLWQEPAASSLDDGEVARCEEPVWSPEFTGKMDEARSHCELNLSAFYVVFSYYLLVLPNAWFTSCLLIFKPALNYYYYFFLPLGRTKKMETRHRDTMKANVLANGSIPWQQSRGNVLTLVWSPPTPEGIIWLFSCQTFHYVHQLVTSFVCHLLMETRLMTVVSQTCNRCLKSGDNSPLICHYEWSLSHYAQSFDLFFSSRLLSLISRILK